MTGLWGQESHSAQKPAALFVYYVQLGDRVSVVGSDP